MIETALGPTTSETGLLTTMVVGEEAVVRLQTKVSYLFIPTVLFRILMFHPAVGRKRRRSLSPYDRDRYDPRPRYNDDYGPPPLRVMPIHFNS